MTTPSWPDPVLAHLPWLLRRVNQRYRATIRARLAAAGFDLPQPAYWALMVLSGGATDASQLTTAMGVTKQAISKLVDALVTAGLVRRRPNRADRRRTDLVLSPKGRTAADLIKEAARETEATFVAELGDEQFADLVRMLSRLAGAPGG